jgi:glycosyltransferase involved in cell wall biosynthesis
MKVAVMAPYVPHGGVRHAGGRHLLNWSRALARAGATVTVIAPVRLAADGTVPELGLDDGEPFDLLPVVVPPAPDGRLRALLRAGVLGPEPGVARAHGADDRVGAVLRSSDVVEVHWTEWAAVEAAVRRRQGDHGRPVVLGIQDVMADAKARQATTALHLHSRLIARLQRPLFTRVEREACNRSAGVLVFSPRDERLLRDIGVRTPIRRIAIGVEPVPRPEGPAGASTVLFVAKFDRKENAQSARWLLDRIWPLVRAGVPDAHLVLAGADPPPWLTTDASRGIEVTGGVDDLDGQYRRARVVIAPIVRGAGLKLKVVEAMHHGLPVVTTEVGADGFTDLGGRDRLAVVSDDPAQLAETTVRLLRDLELARTVGAAGRTWATDAFDVDRSASEVLDWYASLAAP